MEKTTNSILPLTDLRNSFDNDTDIIVSILDMFLEEVPQDYMQLQQYIGSGNYEAAGLQAHKVKSSYRTLGIQHMASILEKIEHQAKNNENTQEIPELLAVFDAKYQDVQAQVIKTKDQI
ncbi:Hpt domain-containing protein [Nonlabens xiamenensis]|uniref:Hpt domain-containing protein n=1 Tax=Nonlabens xiamenensis TaxID=2341043 RepID=UPI000F60E3AE|nr:Hpt domain-containing protein [Nonlabens xiamenensis]